MFFFCPDGITPNSGLTGPNNTLYIWFVKHIFLKTFWKESKLIFSTQLNGVKYCYVSQTNQLNSHQFTHS